MFDWRICYDEQIPEIYNLTFGELSSGMYLHMLLYFWIIYIYIDRK